MFGAVNSLFTGLAFAAVIYAIFLQRKEVGMLKDELSRSKDLMDEQQQLSKSVLDAQKQQIFENTFFQLLSSFSRIVENLDLRSTKNPDVLGKDVFGVFVTRISARHTNSEYLMRKKAATEATKRPTVSEAYQSFYKEYNNELGHYFRTLYNLYKFLDRSSVSNKRLYSNLIRAQLSDSELIILYLKWIVRSWIWFQTIFRRVFSP